jgi:hypothetical protein
VRSRVLALLLVVARRRVALPRRSALLLLARGLVASTSSPIISAQHHPTHSSPILISYISPSFCFSHADHVGCAARTAQHPGQHGQLQPLRGRAAADWLHWRLPEQPRRYVRTFCVAAAPLSVSFSVVRLTAAGSCLRCSALLCVAPRCSALLCVALRCSALPLRCLCSASALPLRRLCAASAILIQPMFPLATCI